MADQDGYSALPAEDQKKNFSAGLKNATGQNPNSLWSKLTGGQEPTNDEKMKAMQKRGSGGPVGF